VLRKAINLAAARQPPLLPSLSVYVRGEGDLSELEAQLAEATGFTIYGHHLEVYGICPSCRAAQEGDHGE